MIYVIGIGVEGRASLGEKTLGIIRDASLVAGGSRHLDEFPELGSRRMPLGGDLQAASKTIGRFLRGKKDIAVLATGDPGLFGIADFLVKRFGKRNVEIMPNVSTVQTAFARIKESWNNVRVMSFHGRDGDFGRLAEEILTNEKVALFTDPGCGPSKVLGELGKMGLGKIRACVFEALGTAKERVTEGTASTLSRRKKFHPLNMMVFTGEGGAGEKTFGISDDRFASSGMMTKEEIRAVALSKMRIKRGGVVWDIGAGCGSVAVAASSIAGAVYAVEKEGRMTSLIERNKRLFNAANVNVIKGAAPECLKALKENPDSVFVGGGGGKIQEILGYVTRRIKKGGRVVVNAVTIETASRALDCFKRKGFPGELVLLNVARTKDIGQLNLLKAHNPVFVITGEKP